MATIDQVKRCFLFYELLDNEIDLVVKDCFVENYSDGEIVFKEGDPGEEFYVILSGKVKLTKTVNDQEVEIMEMHKGEALGETILTQDAIRMTNVIAGSNVDLLAIKQDTIFMLYQSHPKIFGIIMLNLSRLLTKRLQKSNATIAKMHEHLKRTM